MTEADRCPFIILNGSEIIEIFLEASSLIGVLNLDMINLKKIL
jgi:hypothetical protein